MHGKILSILQKQTWRAVIIYLWHLNSWEVGVSNYLLKVNALKQLVITCLFCLHLDKTLASAVFPPRLINSNQMPSWPNGIQMSIKVKETK